VSYAAPLGSNVTAANPFTLQVRENAPVVRVQPKDDDAVVRPERAVTLDIAELRLVNSSSTVAVVVDSIAITSGSWARRATTGGGGQSLQFTAASVGSGGANVSFVFAQYADVEEMTAGGVNFTLTPAMAKLTVSIDGWPWAADHSTTTSDLKLELRVRIGPAWTSSETEADTPRANMTTHTLRGQHGGQVTTTVRALGVAELDGVVEPIEQYIDDAAGQLVFVVPRPFASSLVYDPDFGVVLDLERGGGDDGEQLALIVGVSVAIPVAVVVVLTVVVVAVVVAYLRRRQAGASAINFDDEEPNTAEVL
jgi:hypothetical protein